MDQNNPKNAENFRNSTEEANVDPVTSPSPSSTSTGRYKRSYTCTFCEKGFSNAQALGGHMNIHRRDRARLRNPDERSKDDASLPVLMINWQMDNQRPISDRHDHQVALHLFDDKAQPAAQLDLELRLGPRPASQPSSSSSPNQGS